MKAKTVSIAEAIALLRSIDQIVSSRAPEGMLETQVTLASSSLENCTPASIYIAYQGIAFDGHKNINAAVDKQVPCIIYDSTQIKLPPTNAVTIQVKNSRRAWGFLSALLCSNPQQNMTFIGVTGTNGKTSTTWLLKEMLRLSTMPYLFIGTVGCYSSHAPSKALTHTTPDPDMLFPLLETSLNEGVRTVVMEVSSHAIAQEKLGPIIFDYVGYTSFSRDHLDFHLDMHNYAKTKRRLLTDYTHAKSLSFVHLDVKNYYQNHAISLPTCHTYGSPCSKYFAQLRQHSTEEKTLTLTEGTAQTSGSVSFIGQHSADNFLLASTIFKHLTKSFFPPERWQELSMIPGRLERIDVPDRTQTIYIDYAHTPEALSLTLETLKKSYPKQPLWVAFGCGGNRDLGKRPLMGAAAASLADHVIITSDNPRWESPAEIISAIESGMPSTTSKATFIQRKDAIIYALTHSEPHAVLLIAGKGHETGQTTAGVTVPFNDKLIIQECTEPNIHT